MYKFWTKTSFKESSNVVSAPESRPVLLGAADLAPVGVDAHLLASLPGNVLADLSWDLLAQLLWHADALFSGHQLAFLFRHVLANLVKFWQKRWQS